MKSILLIAGLLSLCGCDHETLDEKRARIMSLPRYPGGPIPDYRTPEQREWAREEAAREADKNISVLLNK